MKGQHNYIHTEKKNVFQLSDHRTLISQQQKLFTGPISNAKQVLFYKLNSVFFSYFTPLSHQMIFICFITNIYNKLTLKVIWIHINSKWGINLILTKQVACDFLNRHSPKLWYESPRSPLLQLRTMIITFSFQVINISIQEMYNERKK